MPFNLDTNYYNILNIELSATAGEVKKAYYKLARETHPDKSPNLDDKLFKSILEAYQVLSNPIERIKYDEFLENAANTSSSDLPETSTHHNSSFTPKGPKTPQTDFKSFFAKRKQSRQTKEREEAISHMLKRKLSKEQQKELWTIYQTFVKDENHFKNNQYPVETLKNLLYVFATISLSHLHKNSLNNPEIVDISFVHNFSGLCHAPESIINDLLDSSESFLYQEIANSWNPGLFLKFYRHDVDVDIDLFIKLILISPIAILQLPKKIIVQFLCDQKCRNYREKIRIDTLYKENSPVSNDIEILFEIYKNYDRNILRNFDYSGSFSQNRHLLRSLVRDLVKIYHNDIDFKDFLPVHNVVNLNSLNFIYDNVQEAITCTGELVRKHGEDNTIKFSKINKLTDLNSSWFDKPYIAELAAGLEPTLFRKLLESIPKEKRGYYLFYPDQYHHTYYYYTDRLKKHEDKNAAEHRDEIAKLLPPVGQLFLCFAARGQECPKSIPQYLADICSDLARHTDTLERVAMKYDESSEERKLIQRKIDIFSKDLKAYLYHSKDQDNWIQLLTEYFNNEERISYLETKIHWYQFGKSDSLVFLESMRKKISYFQKHGTLKAPSALHIDPIPFSFYKRQDGASLHLDASIETHIKRSFLAQRLRDTIRVFFGLRDDSDQPANYSVKTYRMGLSDWLLLGIPLLIPYLENKFLSEDKPSYIKVPIWTMIILLHLIFTPPRFLLTGLSTIIALPFVLLTHLFNFMRSDQKIDQAYAIKSSNGKELETFVESIPILHRLFTSEDHPIINMQENTNDPALCEEIYCYGKLFKNSKHSKGSLEGSSVPESGDPLLRSR